MSAEVLRSAAEAMRNDYGPDAYADSPFLLAVAALLDDAAENQELLSHGGDLGPEFDTFMRRMEYVKALKVARAYLGESA